MLAKSPRKIKAFTVIEMLIVLAIFLLLSGLFLVGYGNAKENAKITKSITVQSELQVASEMYYHDMKFYPPDVNRGWDPGFFKPMPWNPDGLTNPGIDCSHCPDNWQELIAERWQGPYIHSWPNLTPWGGKYDYNYWAEDTARYGCSLDAGLYLGIQGDYSNNHLISEIGEKRMLQQGSDADGCYNGESQMVLFLIDD